MSQLIKHKLRLLSGIVLVGLIVPALFSGTASAAAAVCYTYSSTQAYTVTPCSVLMNNQKGFTPADNTCYGMNTSTPQGVLIAPVDCTAAASNGKNLSNIDFSTPEVNGFGTGSGTYNCNGVKTSVNFGCQGDKNQNPVLGFVYAVVRFLTAGVGIVIIASVVVGGIQYTMSRGDPNATSAAIQRITSSAIALLVYLFAFALINYFIPGGILQ